MAIRQLPANPNLTRIHGQAQSLMDSVVAQDPAGIDRIRSYHPEPDVALGRSEFILRDAQVALAREYGFDGWTSFIREVGERVIEERDLHRWFGVELNNRMWDRLSDGSLAHASDADQTAALYAAYAAAYHWMHAGNHANIARAEHLISRVATAIGRYDIAREHAERCLATIAEFPDEMADWDEAFGSEALARALAAVGDPAAAQERDRAIALTAAVASDGDRAVLEAELIGGPWFGLVT